MRIRVKGYRIEGAGIREKLRPAFQSAGERIGSVLVSQTKRRFVESGDEEIAWADLWVNNQDAVSRFTGGDRADIERAKIRANAERAVERVDRDYKAGKITRSQYDRKKRRSEEKSRLASEIERSGTSDLFRAGGKPLRDTGASQASIVSVTEVTDRGVLITVGSPLERVAFHHHGFTKKGPSYIPLTMRARKGWNERLVPGYDYIVLKNVKVPARPIVRVTPGNIEQIRKSWGG